ncbi:hypothetical protein BH721_10565 [Clostridium baratii]|uniref:hypothetical protein n=1 Tax=Clostridium baratii TaxID=1561 RepID=UPI0009D388F5|nr:hypothetical protein [Clostridium baratii]OPF51905.1 hypothetical protein A1M12_05080 [Clostridium baratii]OPF53550.1 hypothetical protein BH721_10565 [Clostridium baratii]OPF56517.1 hypothetical protein BH724_11970 [Clostridium baratii]OPF60597.1 hypothetical protein BH725_08530 [Clostridium baratii]
MKNIFKKSIVAAILFVGLFSIPASAHPRKGPIFMGTIKKVEECKDSKDIKLLVEGYMNACDVYKGEIIIKVNEKTKLHGSCNKKDCKEEIKLEAGDYICAILDQKITKSIPPQASAKKIKVTSKKDRAEKETSVNDVYSEEEKKEDKKTASEDIKEEKKEEEKTTSEDVKEEKKEEKATSEDVKEEKKEEKTTSEDVKEEKNEEKATSEDIKEEKKEDKKTASEDIKEEKKEDKKTASEDVKEEKKEEKTTSEDVKEEKKEEKVTSEDVKEGTENKLEKDK